MALPPQSIQAFNDHRHDLLRALSKCLLRFDLTYIKTVKASPMAKTAVPVFDYFTAFFCRGSTHRFAMTAGHHFPAILTKQGGDLKLIRIGISAVGVPGSESVRLDAAQVAVRFGYSKKLGFDAALVALPLAVSTLLEGLGAEPYHLRPLGHLESDLCVVLGMPLEPPHFDVTYVQVDGHKTELIPTNRVVCVPVEPKSCVSESGLPVFNAEVVSRFGVEGDEPIGPITMNGLSGGPIFAIRFEQSGFVHRLVAVQTSETSEANLVHGCFALEAARVLLRLKSPRAEIPVEDFRIVDFGPQHLAS